jgi:hypothetical protein
MTHCGIEFHVNAVINYPVETLDDYGDLVKEVAYCPFCGKILTLREDD